MGASTDMRRFSATDAAFTGFRIARERRRALPFWFAASLLYSLILLALLSQVPGSAPDPAAIQADPQIAIAFLAQIAPSLFGAVAIAIVGHAIISAAMFRAVLKPNQSAFGYLRLGSDELRLLAVTLLYLAVLIGLDLFGGIAAGLISGAVAAVLKTDTEVVAYAIIVLTLCAAVAVGVRLSLAAPLTFAAGHIQIRRSWEMTRGRFWPILGAFLLALALAMVVAVLGLIVQGGVAAALGGNGVAMTSAEASTPFLSQLLSPAGIANVLISSLINALIWPVLIAPAASIYQDLTRGEPDDGVAAA